MHTTASDGVSSFSDLARIAAHVGLDFIITTDHNVLVKDQEGLRDGVLMLVDSEVHDPNHNPEGNHCLTLGVREDVSAYASDPQALIDAVRAQGGLTFLAHPIDRYTNAVPDHYPWFDWDVEGFTGIELWNYMSEFRGYAINRLVAILMGYLPRLFTTGPWPEMLAKWDELLRERRVVAIGGSDCHARIYHIGPIHRRFLPYDVCFRAVNTHILTPEPFTGDVAHDRYLVYDALRSGHCWVGYDMLSNTAGFRFWAEVDGQSVEMGDEVQSKGLMMLRVRTPGHSDIHLLRDGVVVERRRGVALDYATYKPGVYRVEVWRRYWLRPRGWIFSNPIYVR